MAALVKTRGLAGRADIHAHLKDRPQSASTACRIPPTDPACRFGTPATRDCARSWREGERPLRRPFRSRDEGRDRRASDLQLTCNMSSEWKGHERRTSPRVSAGGVATVVRDGRTVGTYPVRNLSAGGALLVGLAPLDCGQWVRILLALDSDKYVGIDAVIVRQEHERERHAFAVEFRRVLCSTQDLIHDHVLRTLEDETFGYVSMLLVGCSASIREMSNMLRRLSIRPLTVCTPLQVVLALGVHRDILGVIVTLDYHGMSMLPFLSEGCPHLRRVIVSDCTLEPAELAQAVESGAAHAVLAPPWTEEQVADACGVSRT